MFLGVPIKVWLWVLEIMGYFTGACIIGVIIGKIIPDKRYGVRQRR